MHEDEIPVGRAKNLTGKKFNKLTVLYRVANQGQKVMWKCLCDCGKESIVRGDYLQNNTIKSCGCLGLEIKKQNGLKRKEQLEG